MFRTCPHCYSRVVALGDNTCPACRESLDDRTGVDRTRALVTLREGEELPAVCLSCGEPTPRIVKVRRRRTVGNENQSVAIALLIGVVFHALGLLLLLFRKRPGVRIELALPQCSACASLLGKPDARHISWNTHEMTFEVDKKFRKALRAARSAT